MRILIVEDNVLAARTLERQLRKLGHAIERIIDAERLLSGQTELEPDLIITDIFMPDVEGLQLIRLLKSSPLADVPIIAMSGGGSYMGGIPNVEQSFVAKAALAFGAAKFLPKPIALKALRDAVLDCCPRAADRGIS
jgi:CheY-like chemotaxis protein